MRDMAALGVRPPTAIVRVSEHVDAVIDHIREIESHGFAYAAPDGSGIYLDTLEMGGAYGKLRPPRHGSSSGGGVDEAAPPAHPFKRSPADFALWKAAKPGEAAAGAVWASPWGAGRPGWHVECSAMATAVLGRSLDVHSGGVDLAFPHHCNEVAQAECAHGWVARRGGSGGGSGGDAQAGAGEGGGRRWVGAWLHAGHVHLAGRKMSKSLKNFVTVEALLRDGADVHAALAQLGAGGGADAASSPRGGAESAYSSLDSAADRADAFRLYCLSHAYRADVALVPAQLDEAAGLLLRLRRALRSAVAASLAAGGQQGVAVAQRASARPGGPGGGGSDADRSLREGLFAARRAVDEALRADLGTPTALRALVSVASKAAAAAATAPLTAAGALIVWDTALFVADWLACFGLHFPHETLGALRGHWPGLLVGGAPPLAAGLTHAQQSAGGADGTAPDAAPPAAVTELVAFRAAVRAEAIALLKECKAAAKRAGGEPDASAAAAAVAATAAATRLVATCDHVRDTTLPGLGWSVADGGATGPRIERAIAGTASAGADKPKAP